MRLVIFDIQNPIDPQVNGFGIYRTLINGTAPLLIGRFEIPLYPRFSHTHPWESADCGVDDEQITMNWAKASTNNFTDGEHFCTMSQVWEMISDAAFHLNSQDDNALVGTYLWEIRGEFGVGDNNPITQTRYTWALSSILTDGELGVEVEDDNDLPPLAGLTCEFQEHAFLAGDNDNPHYLWWSKRFRPEAWPPENFVEIGDANDPITALVPIAGVLGVFTRDTKYRVTGNATSGFVHFEAISHRGTRAYKAALPTEHGVVFVANDGVFTSNLIGADIKISQEIEQLFLPDNDAYPNTQFLTRLEEPINMSYAHLISAAYFKSKYRFTYVAGSTSTAINREAVYDFDTKKWTINDLSQASYFVEEDADILSAGGQDGKLYRLESGTSDAGSEIAAEWRSKDYEGTTYATRSLFCFFRIDAEVPEGESLTAEFYVDDTLRETATISGARTNVLNPLPENTHGFKWRARLTASSDAGGIKVYGLAAYHVPLVGLEV